MPSSRRGGGVGPGPRRPGQGVDDHQVVVGDPGPGGHLRRPVVADGDDPVAEAEQGEGGVVHRPPGDDLGAVDDGGEGGPGRPAAAKPGGWR